MEQISVIDNGFKDVLVGTELFRALDITQKELMSPIQMDKIKEIAGYLNEHQDPMFVIGRIRNNKGTMPNLDYLTSYVKLNKQKGELSRQLEQVEKDIKFYE